MDRIRRFMMGRYGMDELNIGIFALAVIISFTASFTRNNMVGIIGWVLFIAYIYRTFSKNTSRRYEENQRFIVFLRPIQNWIRKKGTHQKDKDHKYYHCPGCSQTIRVPRGKGKISITCPKCRNQFVKRT